MSTLLNMIKALDNPPQFQRETIAYYRAMVIGMLQEPDKKAHKNALFLAVRAMTEWQRVRSDDFCEFYKVYVQVVHIIDDVQMAHMREGEMQS